MQCTRWKETNAVKPVQLASDVDPDTSWAIIMTGTLAVTAASLVISKNKQS